MIYRLITALTLSATTAVGLITTGGGAPKASTEPIVIVRDTTETVRKSDVPDVYEIMLSAQQATKKVGSVQFWEAVSWCETNHKWNDGGYFSGGLGMALSVWFGYGGKEFASRPAFATKTQQIIVANRAAFLGFQTRHTYASLEDKLNNRPYFRPAVHMPNWGRDCVNWRTRKPRSDKYTQTK